MADVSIVVADAKHLPSIRASVKLPGSMMHYTSGNVGSAMESIRAYRPKIVAVEENFADTFPGRAFIDRVEALDVAGCNICLITQDGGRWTTAARSASAVAPTPPAIPTKTPVVTPPASTRRAPRFAVKNRIDAIVDGGPAGLIDLSVLGAQIVSEPVLRPNQKIKLDLPDTSDLVSVVGMVAWSSFELAHSTQQQPHYRVGVEFSGAARDTLERYRLRYCK